MGIAEDRIRQSQREVDAYNRMANPKAYVLSGQKDRDRASGKLSDKDLQAVVDATNTTEK